MYLGFNTLPRSTLSEPLGNMDQVSSVYFPDQLLETVSEERRIHDSVRHLDEYRFRDSFEHSSNESEFTSVIDAKPMQTTKPPHLDELSPNFQQAVNNTALIIQQNATNNAKIKQFSLLQAFIPSFLFVLMILTIITIFIFESDLEVCTHIKRLPEMISLNYQYYQPFKSYLARTFYKVFQSI